MSPPSNKPILLYTAAVAALTVTTAAADFRSEIEPIFRRHCLKCHGEENEKGRFRVDRRATLLAGGESGEPAVLPGNADASHLMKLITGVNPDAMMPPKGDRLTAAEIAAVKAWIQTGAPTPASYGQDTEKPRLSHWSLRPVRKPPLNESEAIDHLVREKLAVQGLMPSPPAERRILIRRLFFVLLGLPPSPEQVEAFVQDGHPDAWRKLADKTLASPRYGERWAGHWLDLVRFGETHGFETNRERPNAWRYRDWVIEAFNADKPYEQFIREQLAGDALEADIGTGFLVAGPYDQVKGKDPKLRLTQRMNELDDIINTTGTAFLGLTLGCARCHNHMFDPVTQQDYYSLQAVFAGVKHADRALPANESAAAEAAAARSTAANLRRQLAKYTQRPTGALLTIDDNDIAHLIEPAGHGKNPEGDGPGFADDPGSATRSPNISGGQYTWWRNVPGRDVAAYRPGVSGRFRIWLSWGAGYATHSTNAVYALDMDGRLETLADRRLLATVNQQLFADGSGTVVGKALWSGLLNVGVHELESESAIVLHGGGGTAVTTDVLILESAAPNTADRPFPGVRSPVNPRHNVERIVPIAAKSIRFTIEESNGSQPCIDELEIFAGAENVALATKGARATSGGDFPHPKHRLAHVNDGRYGNSKSWIAAQASGGWVQIDLPAVTTIDRIEWGRDREGNYTDRLAVRYRIEVARETDHWLTVASSQDRLPLGARPGPETAYDFASFPPAEAEQGRRLLKQLESVTSELKKLSTPLLAYAGTFEQPGPTHRLYRGEPDQPREEVPPAGIAALTPLRLDRNAPEQERRLAVANWIASTNNPLTARVIVNRLWQFHFGEGFVDTPSDFGANGTKPTHPELLDWLAAELMEHGWSLKHIHRLILNSKTWRQDSRPSPDAIRVDAASRLLWRFPSRRLEAEGIRDTMLAVTGVLDLKAGGPGFSAFEVEAENVRHYHAKSAYGPADWRRMIYMTKVRQEHDSTFGVFDCPDASQVVPKRSRSTTPLQALNLLNSGFVMQQADLLAKRLTGEAAAGIGPSITRAYHLCFGRAPTDEELQDAAQFINDAGLLQFCRAMLNANESVFIP